VGHVPAILRRRARLITTVWIAIAALAFWGSFFIPQLTTAAVLIGEGADESGPNGLSSENSLVNLTPLSLSQLVDSPQTSDDLLVRASGFGGSLKDASFDAFLVPGGKVVEVRCQHEDPDTSVLLANSMAEVLLDRNREFLRKQAGESVARFDRRILEENDNLSRVRAEIREIRERHSFSDISEALKSAQRDLDSARRRTLRAEDDRWRREQQLTNPMPNVSASAAVSGTRNIFSPLSVEIRGLMTKRSELLLSHRAKHPEVRLLDGRIANLRERQKNEKAAARGAILDWDPTPDPNSAAAALTASTEEERISEFRAAETKSEARVAELVAVLPYARRLQVEENAIQDLLPPLKRQLAGFKSIVDAPTGRFKILEQAGGPLETGPSVPISILGLAAITLCLVLTGVVVAFDVKSNRVMTAADMEAASLAPTICETDHGQLSEAKRRGIYDRAVQSLRSAEPGKRVILVAGVSPEDGASRVWEQLLLACRRIGYQGRGLDLAKAEPAEGVGKLVEHHEWCSQDASRVCVVLLPSLQSKTASAAFVWGSEMVMVVAGSGRYGASDLGFWFDTLPGGREAVTRCMLVETPSTGMWSGNRAPARAL